MNEELKTTGDDGLIAGPMPLTPQEETFCAAFGDPESETYGKATASAEVAKYIEPHNAAWKLRRRPRIIAKLEEYQKTAAAAAGRVMSDLEHERQLALAKDDIASAIRASELMGKHLGMFLERSIFTVADLEVRRQYSEAEQIEARRLSALLLLEDLSGEAPPAQLPATTSIGRRAARNGE